VRVKLSTSDPICQEETVSRRASATAMSELKDHF
jgi:hypothetical protein